MELGKSIVILGLSIVAIGLFIWLFEKTGIKLPGDISVKGEHYAVYFPLASMLLLSIFLTIVINLILWGMRR